MNRTGLLILASLLTQPLSAAGQAPTRRDSVSRLDTVRIRDARSRGYAAPSTRSATRSSARLVDIPLSLTVLTRGQLDDQATQSMADVVRYLPAITMGQGEGHRDQPTTRGISSTADLYLDGVRDDAQYYRDVYNVERVEALRGPNALAFGRGGGGGVLNRVMRQADFASHRTLRLETRSFQQMRGTLDLGGALGARAATRLNAVAEDGRSFRDITITRAGINPTVALVVGGGLLRASFEHFEDRRTVDRGLPSFDGRPAPIDQAAFFGDRSVNRARAVVNHGRVEYERAAGAHAQLRTVVAWSEYDKMYQNLVPGAMNAGGTTVSLSAYRNETDRRNLFSQTDLTWQARTGAVMHAFLAGAEFGTQRTANFRETGYFANGATSTSVAVTSFGVSPEVAFRQSASDADNRTRATVAAAYAQHQGNFGRAWQSTLGVRVERLAMEFEDFRNDQTLQREDVMVTPRAGLVFKPRSNASVYASLATSALPSAGDQFASLTATTAALRPERFETREAGAKWEPSSRLRLTAAYFLLTRSRSSAPDPARAGVVVQTGKQESRGVELEAQGEVRSGWQLTGAYTAQRARIVSRTTSAAAGATIPLVPAQTLALWNRVQLRSPLAAAVGVVHQARMYAAIDNAVTLPSFTRIDGALFYSFGTHLLAQVNIENIANARFVVSAHSNNNLQPGAPRSVRVSLTVR